MKIADWGFVSQLSWPSTDPTACSPTSSASTDSHSDQVQSPESAGGSPSFISALEGQLAIADGNEDHFATKCLNDVKSRARPRSYTRAPDSGKVKEK